jgi:hypothetical protein
MSLSGNHHVSIFSEVLRECKFESDLPAARSGHCRVSRLGQAQKYRNFRSENIGT